MVQPLERFHLLGRVPNVLAIVHPHFPILAARTNRHHRFKTLTKPKKSSIPRSKSPRQKSRNHNSRVSNARTQNHTEFSLIPHETPEFSIPERSKKTTPPPPLEPLHHQQIALSFLHFPTLCCFNLEFNLYPTTFQEASDTSFTIPERGNKTIENDVGEFQEEQEEGEAMGGMKREEKRNPFYPEGVEGIIIEEDEGNTPNSRQRGDHVFTFPLCFVSFVFTPLVTFFHLPPPLFSPNSRLPSRRPHAPSPFFCFLLLFYFSHTFFH